MRHYIEDGVSQLLAGMAAGGSFSTAVVYRMHGDTANEDEAAIEEEEEEDDDDENDGGSGSNNAAAAAATAAAAKGARPKSAASLDSGVRRLNLTHTSG